MKKKNSWQEFVNSMYTRGEFPEPPSIGEFPDEQQKALAISLIEEEVNKELLTNLKNVKGLKMTEEQLALFLDDVIDSLWVIIWAARVVGVDDLDPFYEEVGRTNNAKIPVSGPIKHPVTGKLQKPEGWQKPNMLGTLRTWLKSKLSN